MSCWVSNNQWCLPSEENREICTQDKDIRRAPDRNWRGCRLLPLSLKNITLIVPISKKSGPPASIKPLKRRLPIQNFNYSIVSRRAAESECRSPSLRRWIWGEILRDTPFLAFIIFFLLLFHWSGREILPDHCRIFWALWRRSSGIGIRHHFHLLGLMK